MTQAEINEFFDDPELEFYDDKPKIGDYFGVLTKIYCIIPYIKNNVMGFTYSKILPENDLVVDVPLLFKRIDEETALEVSTKIQFLFNAELDVQDTSNPADKLKSYTEKFHKYRKICLEINNCDYIVPNDEFKKFYHNSIDNDITIINLETYLDYMSRKAHEIFESETAKIINEAHSIAMIDNAIYDLEKNKVNTLTRKNDGVK